MKKPLVLTLVTGLILGLGGAVGTNGIHAANANQPGVVKTGTKVNQTSGPKSALKILNRNQTKRQKPARKYYQNPKRYYQINYKQIKPYGKVGHDIGVGYEGIKSWKVEKRTHTYTGYTKYSYATRNAVASFQRRHHLPATGRVNEATWVKMGLPKKQWTSIDAYVAPLGAKPWQGRKAHINAAIRQAKRYLGRPFLDGASSSPRYGTDCSGLVMQALYAGGINPKPISSIHHGYPGNEWNSRNLWRSRKFKHVPFRDRRRGDLIFYYEPGTHVIYHVGLYLGHDRVIDSWPNHIAIRNLWGVHPDVAGAVRPWL